MLCKGASPNSNPQPAVEEQIYRIVDTETGRFVMTGRTKHPVKRAKQYTRYPWWDSKYKLEPYRTVERNSRADEAYGIYAAVVEHIEICRNQTWQDQGGRNQMSPIRQCLWGPEAIAERSRIGGLVSVESGQLALARSLAKTKVAQREVGRRAVASGQLASICAKGGRASVKSEHFADICAKGGRAMAESGQLALISNSPQTKAAQREAGRASVESGQLALVRNLPQAKAAQREVGRRNAESGQIQALALRNNHKRWHVNRNISNPVCELCQAIAA